jgi:hypothetical protein
MFVTMALLLRLVLFALLLFVALGVLSLSFL